MVWYRLIALSLVLFAIFTFIERRTDKAFSTAKLIRLPVFFVPASRAFFFGFVFFLFYHHSGFICRNDSVTTH